MRKFLSFSVVSPCLHERISDVIALKEDRFSAIHLCRGKWKSQSGVRGADTGGASSRNTPGKKCPPPPSPKNRLCCVISISNLDRLISFMLMRDWGVKEESFQKHGNPFVINPC